MTQRIGSGLAVGLAGAVVGSALGVAIVFGYGAVVNLEPRPSHAEVQRLEVATLLLLAGWASVVAAVMVLLQRWWHGARLLATVTGGVVLIVGGWFLTWLMSFLNECEAGHSYPLPWLHC